MRLAVISLLALAVLSACKSTTNDSTTTAKDAAWPKQMQNMAQDVKKLLPFLYDREAYRDPKNRDEIRSYLREFSQVAHHINPEKGKPFIGDDLLLEYSLSNLKDDLTRASKSFDAGQYEYSRLAAKASLSHCFQCHSVTQAGGKAGWDLEQVHNLGLQPLEKADLLVATRKYDKALAYMEGLLNSPEFLQNHAFDFESLLRRYLALIIRVENAPQRALKELDKILERGATPHYIAEQANGWRQSLTAWAKEKKQPIRNAKDLFAQVDSRFKKAAAIQHFEKDHAGDVEYLRATAALHEGMKLLKAPADQARALYMLGRAYEVLDELGSWNLHESYYEACALKDPKSSLAERCFGRLEASLYMGYSGSAGTNLPLEERARLKNLKDQMQRGTATH
ncbi:MAG: hypothetical protein KF799_05945 [Bdellovibrionales bacterium]|nr:hypothetical protein [Bdellovibrionales bacterium]